MPADTDSLRYCTTADGAAVVLGISQGAAIATSLALVDDTPVWRPTINLRGLQSLRVRAGAV